MKHLIKFLLILLSLTVLLSPGYALFASKLPSENYGYSNSQTTMTMLHIALQDGFVDDEVIIQVNGENVFHQSGVNTRFQIGFAASFDVNVQQGAVEIEVILPLQNQAKSTVLDVLSPIYLGVSITMEGEIEFQNSAEPFRYM